jgi:hypothetical protein
MSNIQSGFIVDGKIFATKAEAEEFVRGPKVKEALMILTGKNVDLSTWLIEKKDEILENYESGKIKRVTKQERKALGKALTAAVDLPACKFLADNFDAIVDSFRWPSVKRGTAEEQAEQIRTNFADLAEGNEEMVKWLLTNKEQLLAAYEAGKEKRQVSEKAAAGLAAYREKKAAEKAAAEKAAA